MMSSLYSFEFANSINDLSADEWNGVAGGDYPFLRHEFLAALEASGSVSSSTGWEPHHLLIRKKDRLLGLMPCYLKQHSYGEYVFDWGWADAYHRHGISYYPKLVSSIPFTPCVGPRLVLVDQTNSSLIEETQQFVIDYCENQGFSSWHLLFPEQPACDKPDLLKRVGVQFHWYNKGFSCFEDYLSIMASRKRKSIKKEREKVRAHGIHFRWLEGKLIEKP